MTMLDAETAVDFSDPDLYRGGGAERAWARALALSPVHRVRRPAGDFWAVLGHQEIVAVLKDSAGYGSEQGMRLDHDPRATAMSAGRMLIVTDPPRHGALRRIINSAFTPRMVHRLENTMRATVADLLDRAIGDEPCEFTEIASWLPVSVICDMLGVPRQDWAFMLDRTRTAFGAASEPADPLAVAEAHVDLLSYYEELAARRRREPGDDIVTALVKGRVDGVPLSDEEIYLNCDGLISGGNETTRHATVGGMLAFIDHPEQWDLLRQRPELLGSAVQEILRHSSPALHVLRTATAAGELAGQRIEPGEQVALFLAAGNRDERVFTDPDSFDITRFETATASAKHLAFAQGAHFCLGAALAGKELEVMFSALVQRVERAEAVAPPKRMRSNLIWGFESARLHLPPRR
ncbi:cytochrome P450 [Actinokineospora guangxiensis]|uniref:Cytochrome P450 n=1 Tax=Actinokineospora guangxiensis TaxID=1490288 RepID=A0ABW0EGY3_9PSEU